MDRRDFLRMSSGRGRTVELSCESLYMRFLDSQADGKTGELRQRMLEDLRGARTLRLRHSFWLDRTALKDALEPLLSEFRRRGGRIDYA